MQRREGRGRNWRLHQRSAFGDPDWQRQLLLCAFALKSSKLIYSSRRARRKIETSIIRRTRTIGGVLCSVHHLRKQGLFAICRAQLAGASVHASLGERADSTISPRVSPAFKNPRQAMLRAQPVRRDGSYPAQRSLPARWLSSRAARLRPTRNVRSRCRRADYKVA
jgi:hypothetical protein